MPAAWCVQAAVCSVVHRARQATPRTEASRSSSGSRLVSSTYSRVPLMTPQYCHSSETAAARPATTHAAATSNSAIHCQRLGVVPMCSAIWRRGACGARRAVGLSAHQGAATGGGSTRTGDEGMPLARAPDT
jgi:hypothetical protein